MYPLRPPSISMHCMLSVLCTLMMQCPSLLDWPDHLFVACYGPAHHETHTTHKSTKYQNKNTRRLINSNNWQRDIIKYPKAPPLGSTATYTQQCSLKNCKRKVSPNPSHHHTIGPLPLCS